MLVKKTLQFITLFAIVASSFLPAFSAKAYGGYYTYRSTVFGTGVSQTGQYVYEIQNQKDRFNTNDSVFFMTRIFNITNVSSFSFKHEIRGAGVYREFYSDYYTPNKHWWAEIYYWKEIGQLPAGTYETKTYINVDNEGYKLINAKNFSVETAYNPYYSPQTYPSYPSYDSYNPSIPYYAEAAHYSYNFTNIGKNIRKTGDYSYEIVSRATEFSTNEDVYVLASLSDIRGIDSFRIKFELWLNGNKLQKTNEVPTLWPHRERWAYNYSWGNLGKLPRGEYQIRTLIQTDGGFYRQLNTQQIYVGGVLSGYEKCDYPRRDWDRPCDGWNGRRYHDVEHYKYEWSKLGTDIKSEGGYDYSIVNPKSSFYTDENVKVLTRISELRGIDKFQLKYKLYLGNILKKEYLASEQKPNWNRWNYNYSNYNFGKIQTAGSYSFKVFISVEGGSYKLLDTKSFTVNQKYTHQDRDYYPCYVDHDHDYYDHYSRTGTDSVYYSNDYNRPYSPYYR